MKTRLYHFTNLLGLPEIIRDGITKGELPLDRRVVAYGTYHAANLTANNDRAAQQVWAYGTPCDKTRIRITVVVPQDELTSYQAIRQRFGDLALDSLAPPHERKHWWYAFGGVRPDCFVAVKILEGLDYRAIGTDELMDLCSAIVIERDRAIETRSPEFVEFKSETWLKDVGRTSVRWRRPQANQKNKQELEP